IHARRGNDRDLDESPGVTSVFPVGLRLNGLPVLVVGGGRVAERRVRDLLNAGARITVVSPEISADLDELHRDAAITWFARKYQHAALDGCWLVQAATDVPAVNDLAAEHAYTARVFCFKGGDPLGATAWRPAVAELDDVTVAVSAGATPPRAKEVR